MLPSSSYSLSLNAPAVGQIWGIGGAVIYPLSGSPIANNTSITITRTLPITQLTSITNQGDFYPQVVEQGLDTQCLELQQVASRTGSFVGVWQTGIQYNYADIVQDGVNGDNTQNYYLCIIPNTSSTWSADLVAGDWALALNVQQVSDFADAAAASAAAALVSQNAAAASATTSANSATAAQASSVSAAGSASTASMQASTATLEATLAANSATSAGTAASTASTASTSASTSATTATTEANLATSSATSAATAATNAALSAILAASTLTASSTSSNTIGTGTKNFTIQTNKQFQPGQNITSTESGNTAQMFGIVTSYNSSTGALVMNSTGTPVGSGTFTNWNISISGTPGANGAGTGTLTSLSVVTANGVSGSVANPTTTPAVTLTLGAITPSTVNALTLAAVTNGFTVAGGSTPATLTVPSSATVSGTNSGDVTLAAVGSSPSANGATISGQTITLQPADGTHPGLITTGAQTIAGAKTFSSTIGGSISGNAATATALATGRTINGTTFDGTANITVAAAAGTVTGATLASNVTASSIVTLGTLTNVTTNNVSTAAHGFAPKLPNDATKFFDGTGNYTVPAASAVFTQSYTSADLAISSSGSFSLAHGFGSVPTLVMCYLIAQTSVLGYTAGDIVAYNVGISEINSQGRSHIITLDSTNINLFYGNDPNTYNILNKSTRGIASITNTDWKLRIKAWV